MQDIKRNCIPQISVIMSVYKEPLDWLRQSIDSILNQTFSDFEFIIICDNPQYIEGAHLLREYEKNDSRIRLIFNDINIGLTKSLNKGLSVAKGEYIARMDADDISMKDRFSEQVDFLGKFPIIDVCGTNIIMFGDIDKECQYPEKHEEMFFFIDNCLAHSSVMMRKRVARMAYNETYKTSQDYELWCRAYKMGVKFHNIQKPLLKYRWSKEQISNKNKKSQTNFAKLLRRDMIDYYCEVNKINLHLNNNPITFDYIDVVRKTFNVGRKDLDKLLYYLLISNTSKSFHKFCFILRSRLIFRLQINRSFRVLYYSVLNINNAKF